MATDKRSSKQGVVSPPSEHQYHFISGLPRSGSMLLSAILRQNPRLHADMSSPVGGLFNMLLTDISARNEGAVFIDNARRSASSEIRMR